jgi:4-O-beta-D-mannosyl-D-glucose phosphorylase
VAVTSVEKLLDFTLNTDPDGFTSAHSVQQINKLIEKNQQILRKEKVKA